MKKHEVSKIVAYLAAAFPQAQVTEATSEVYETMLADLDFEPAQEAVHRLCATSEWLPTIAKIRATYTDITRGPRRTGAEAHGDVLAEIRRVGAYDKPRFVDPIVAECVASMGWRGLCLGDNEAADRARFIELYDRLSERDRQDAVVGRALPKAQYALRRPESVPYLGMEQPLTQSLKPSEGPSQGSAMVHMEPERHP